METARGLDDFRPFDHTCALALRAIATLRSAQFNVTIDYHNQTSLAMQLRFDLGSERNPPRLYMLAIARRGAVVTYAGELVQIGACRWQRQADGAWLTEATCEDRTEAAEAIRRRVGALLPGLDLAQCRVAAQSPSLSLLSWTDEGLNADMLLEVEPQSGTPRRFRRETRSTNNVLTVICSDWNQAVQIDPPDRATRPPHDDCGL